MENNAEKLKENLASFTAGVLRCLPERQRDIIIKRFGLKGEREKTLEEIGRDYKISRERIRQIEKEAFKKLKAAKNNESAAGVFGRLHQIVEKRGGVVGERNLIKIVLEEETNCPAKGALFLALELDEEMERIREDKCFKKRWVYDTFLTHPSPSQEGNVLKKIKKIPSREGLGCVRDGHEKENLKKQIDFINHLTDFFSSAKKMVDFEKMLEMFRKKIALEKRVLSAEFDEREALLSYLEASKLIEQNYFGQWGLVSWPEIKPRSIKDKIYLALSKSSEPLHFLKITEQINEICQDKKMAKHQTVHNELIKDERYILVGRGIYALKEWGYQPGDVKRVITGVLGEKNEPLAQNEIIREVLKRRQVKKNTILVNLKNHSCFVRLNGSRYKLKS